MINTENDKMNKAEMGKVCIVHCRYKKYIPNFNQSQRRDHHRWVPCRRSMACPQVAVGDGLWLCLVAANTLNKQPRTADKVWSSSLLLIVG
jgi:hypothetical protein